jgi:hypothetical protein
MIIGASCSVKVDDYAMEKSASEFSTVLAWILRWEIFGCMHTQTDNLWVFQALLLLEVYEKTYSSRTMHERAHIHHATTITLMRRGSFLMGKSPLNSPPSYRNNMVDTDGLSKPSIEAWWIERNRREAIRRVAFAAFMIDSIHAAMFGHSMIMVTHEMRLELPCNEALWSAKSANEVLKIENVLHSNGIRPLSFLECLQKTLSGQEIHTDAFGRSILLCGLLSVSWHMNQRDLQLKSLNVGLHSREKGTSWRTSITKAFDLWRGWYDKAAADSTDSLPRWCRDEDAVLGSRVALYHLAQISMHVDIVECQVFAGAERVVGRSIGKREVEAVRRRLRNGWAPTIEARKATFYALRFLSSVLHMDVQTADQTSSTKYVLDYANRKTDLPINRWVLYSAALVVWCYSYAIDGPTHVVRTKGTSIEDHIQDMHQFLKRTENIKDPEDLAYHRLNSCAGMLKVLRFICRNGTWDLMHEGANLLTNCIKLIDPVE